MGNDPDGGVETAPTSPLNVELLFALATSVRAVTGSLRPILGLGVLTVALSAAMAVSAAQFGPPDQCLGRVVARGARRRFREPVRESALGLRSAPIAASSPADHTGRLRSPAWLGVLAGLLVLTRPDFVIVVTVVYLATPAMRHRFWVVPLTAAAGAVAWYAFSWYHFGSRFRPRW